MAMTLGALMRDAGAARVRKVRGPSRQGLEAAQRRDLHLPAYLTDFRLIPGLCRRRRCKSRYGVVRVSIDYRDRDRFEVLATVECASCHRTWRRTRAPKLGEYQHCRVTLILPAHQRRYYARKRWHVEGDDAVVIRDATWSELMAAADDWRTKNVRRQAARARLAERKAREERETHEATMNLLERLAERDRQRELEEAAADGRE